MISALGAENGVQPVNERGHISHQSPPHSRVSQGLNLTYTTSSGVQRLRWQSARHRRAKQCPRWLLWGRGQIIWKQIERDLKCEEMSGDANGQDSFQITLFFPPDSILFELWSKFGEIRKKKFATFISCGDLSDPDFKMRFIQKIDHIKFQETMECVWNPSELIRFIHLEKSLKKVFGKWKQNFESDWKNFLSTAIKWADHLCHCQLRHLLLPNDARAKMIRYVLNYTLTKACAEQWETILSMKKSAVWPFPSYFDPKGSSR